MREMLYFIYTKIMRLHNDTHPELRVGQLMSNFEQWLKDTKGVDMFYLDDDRFAELLEEYLKGRCRQ